MTSPLTTRGRLLAVAVSLALAAGGVLVGPAAGMAAAEQTLTASPREGDRAVRDGRVLRASGPAPAGRVVSARLVGLDAAGAEVGAEAADEGAYNAPPERGSFVRNDDGQISAVLGLGCLFGAPDGPGSAFCDFRDVQGTVHSAQLEVTLEGGAIVTSSLVPVDHTAPVIRRYRVVAPNTVEVLFSEPVRHRQGDSPTDWTLRDPPAQVTSVEQVPGSTCELRPGDDPRLGTDQCTRLLRVVGLPEDAQPFVEYAAGINRLGAVYEDFTANGIDRSDATGSGARGIAVDVVRPAVPRIDSVAGRGPSSGDRPTVVGRDLEPAVRLSNLTPGHKVRVLATTPSGAELASEQVEASGVSSEDGSATVRLFTLGAQGGYELLAEAQDDNGNLSTAPLKPARADGSPNPVRYVLDTLPPALVAARGVGSTAVDVIVTEPVSGPNRAADWLFTLPDGSTRQPESVSGSDAQRRLTVSGIPGGSTLSYRPSSQTDRYVDAAGNVLPDSDLPVDGVALPRVTVPDSPVFTPQTAFTIRGTADPGSRVEVFRRDGEGRPTGEPLAPPQQLPAGSEAFAVDVQLGADGAYDLAVVSSRDGARSPAAVVPRITRDTVRPDLRLTSPTSRDVYPGNAEREITWEYRDTNPGAVKVELSLDDGATWSVLSPGERPTSGSPLSPDSGSFTWRTPQVSTEAARIRLTGTDKAGNAVQQLSGPFVIDALLPRFVAETTAPRTVRVTFSEPVSGPVAPGDFRVDGQPAPAGTARAEGARSLTITAPSDFGEDGEPTVTYAPSPAGQLADRAGQGIVERTAVAVDRIRPAVPTITAVDGRAPDENRRLQGGSVAPQLTVTNVTSGHDVRVERVPATGSPVPGPQVRADGGPVLATAPRLPDDGEHVLRVVVFDPRANASTESGKNAARTDGGPSAITYVLDTDLPAVLFAVVDNDQITVRFTEAVFPTGGDPADWRVTRPDGSPVPRGDGSVEVVRVTGAGDTRVLQATGAPSGALLVYAPKSSRYTDANTNPLPDTTTPLLALDPPVVSTPPRALLVTTNSTPVAGTAQPSSTVSLFRRGADGAAGTALASSPVDENGRWSLTAPLDNDRAHDFLVQARRADGRDTIAVAVPTITQDGAAPVLSVSGLPGDQQALPSGGDYTFQWSVCDANLGPTPMTFEYSLDSGGRWTQFGAERQPSANDCSAEGQRQVTLPVAETRQALLRVTATDLAGRTTSTTSPRFVLAQAPASGATPVRDVRAFACPSDRVQPAGFTDTDTSTFRFEIDCLAAYGFTKGVTSDRYAPANNVTRAQMAMFVARLGAYGGVALDTRDAGFNDLGDAPQETRDAVNALANLGVVQGVGGGRYDPAGRVSRAQMASFLARLQPSVGQPFAAGPDAFGDDQGDVHEANINAIAAAGIVQGKAPGTYQPVAPITRQQMAGFLMRYVDGRVEAGEMRSAY